MTNLFIRLKELVDLSFHEFSKKNSAVLKKDGSEDIIETEKWLKNNKKLLRYL